MNDVKEYDFVVYGATGFTGKLVVEYLVEKYSNNSEISWALAGRNLEKLETVATSKNVPEDTGLLVVIVMILQALRKWFQKQNVF